MPILHLGQLQLEVRRRSFAGTMIPSVGEQDTADIQKQCRDRRDSFHWVGSGAVWRFGFVIAWYIISSLRNGEPYSSYPPLSFSLTFRANSSWVAASAGKGTATIAYEIKVFILGRVLGP